MWKISEKLRKSLNAFRAAEPRSYARRFQSRPSIRRLEQRRVLNAEFSLDGSTLTLENFQNNVNDLTIANDIGGDYTFTLSDGVWSEAAGSDANGFTGAGTDTLTVAPADVLAMLVDDSGSAVDFGVLLDDPNFAGDTLELAGVGPVSQTLLAPMTFDTLTLNADNGSFEVPSLILVGDLVVENATDISDGMDASIDVSGNASFTATNNITLANEDSGGNELIVGDTASFTSTNGDIRVGVEDGAPDPSQGALANVQIGSISLTTGGSFTVVSDNDLTEVSVDVDPGGDAEEYNLNVSGNPGFVFDVTDNGDDLLVNEVDTPITLSITTRTGDLLVDEVNVANELTLKTDDGSIHVRDLGVTVGGAAKLDSSEAIVLEASVTGTTVGLVAGTNITQDPNGIITATELLVMAENIVLLDVANNNVDIIAADVVNDVDPAVDGVFRFRSIAGLTVGSVTVQGMTVTGVTAAAEAKIRADDNAALTTVDLQLDEAVEAGLVGLIADGNITQAATGVVTTGTAADEGLYLMAGGDVLLEEQNAIAGLAAEADQFLRVNTTVDVFVRELAFVQRNLQPPMGAMVTSVAMGPLAGATAAAEVKLTSDQSIVTLEAIAAPAIWLAAGQDITQRLNGEIRGLDAMNPADLVVIAGRSVLLDQLDNSVDNLAADVEGFFRFNTVESLNVTQLSLPMRAIGDATSAAMGPVVGVNSAVEAKLLSDGAITLSEDIGAPTVFLKAASDITQILPARVRGTLSTESAELIADAGGDIMLANPANRISVVNSSAITGTTRIATATDLTIKSLSTDPETIITPAPDSVEVESLGMDLRDAMDVAGGIVKYESAGSISVETRVTADQIGLVTGNDITQDAAGILETAQLLVMAEGNAILDDAANKVGTVAADIGDGTAGIFRLLSTETLTVGQVTVIDMTITGISSDADANDATPGLINEVKLTVQGADRDLFLVNAVQGNRVGLVAGRSIAQTAQGVITTGTDLTNHGLLVMAEVDALLDQADNVVREVVGDVNGAFRFRTIVGLTVGDVTIDGMQVVGISADANANLGAANRSAEVKLTADDGNAATSVNLNLAQGVQANLVGLIADGDITQTATGLITTGVETVLGNGLFVMAGGDVLLGEDNSVTRLAANVDVDPMVDGTDQDLRLKTTTNLVVGTLGFGARTVGATSSAMMPTFAGIQADGFAKLIAGGTIDIERMVTAAQVGLVAEGTITQDTAGVITTPELLVISPNTGATARNVILDDANNAVDLVAADVQGVFRLKSTTDLAVGTVTVDGMTATGISADGDTGNAPVDPSDEVKLISAGAINLTQAIEADEVFLMAGTTVDQVSPGIVIATTLLVDAGNSITLELDNQVDNFAAIATVGHVLFNSARDLNIVSDTIDGMTVNGVTASTYAKLVTAGSLDVQAPVTAAQVGLVAGTAATNNITQTSAGLIITPELLLMAVGDVTLQQDNEVEEIAADVDGNLYFRTTTDLVVGQVTIVTGPAVVDRMTVTGISSDGDTADGTVNASGDVKLQATQLGMLPADERSLHLNHAIEAADAFLIADNTITQSAIGALEVDSVMLQAGGDVTLQNRNNVPVGVRGNLAPVLAANVTEGSLLFNTDTALTIDGLQFVAPDATTSIEGITILDSGTDQTLRLELSAAGDVRQDPIDPLLAMPGLRSRIDADVDVAMFTVTPGSSILLADIDPTIAANRLDDVTYRQRTENRFFDDNAGSPNESQLVFETFTAGRIADLTIFDQTAVVLEDTDVVPDGTAIDITGDLTIIGGRSPEAGLVPTGLAIGSTAAVKVEGEAQFHAIGGNGPSDQSINLPDLEINTDGSGTGDLVVTTNNGDALLVNSVGVNFRDDLRNTIAGDLDVTASANDVTDQMEAQILVQDTARFVAALGDIVLADTNNLADGTNNRLIVGDQSTFQALSQGRLDVGVQASGGFANATVELGSLSFNTDNDDDTANSGQVRIAEDSDMLVALADFNRNGTANEVNEGGDVTLSTTLRDADMMGQNIDLDSMRAHRLTVASMGYIHDSATNLIGSSDIQISTAALFQAVDEIELAEQGASNKLFVGDNAKFESTGIKTIDVGVLLADGTDADAETAFGTLTFVSGDGVTTGAQVRISEDKVSGQGEDGTLLTAANSAGSLLLRSAGDVEDFNETSVRVVNDSEVLAGENIVLADQADSRNLMIVGGNSKYVAINEGDIDVGVRTTGASNEGANASAQTEFGTLTFVSGDGTTSGGTVRISEDNTMNLAADNTAGTLRLLSTQDIEDGNEVSVRVMDNAEVLATNNITLADQADRDNLVFVGGNAKFASSQRGDIDVGVRDDGADALAQTAFGTLTFISGDGVSNGGTVRIHEDKGLPVGDDGVLLTAANTAGVLVLSSDQDIADETATAVNVAGSATFTALSGDGSNQAIVLSDKMADALVVGSEATFLASKDNSTRLGVDQNNGQDSGANVQFNALRFDAAVGGENGDVTINEDDGTNLFGNNRAKNLILLTGNSLTDAAGTSTRVDELASFYTTNTDDDANEMLILGDDISGSSTELDLNRVTVPDEGQPDLANKRFGSISLAEGMADSLHAEIILEHVFAKDVLFVSNENESGHILQDVTADLLLGQLVDSGDPDNPMTPDVDESKMPLPATTTTLEADEASFLTTADADETVGGIVLRSTAFNSFAANSSGSAEIRIRQDEVENSTLTDFEAVLNRLSSSTLDNDAAQTSLQPVIFEGGGVDDRDVGSHYALFIGQNSSGMLTIGQAIADPATGAMVQGLRTPEGNVFLESQGNITFNATGVAGATSEGGSALENVAVDIDSNFVFTAVATEELKIVAGTELVSYQGSTVDGVVKDVHTSTAYQTFDGRLDPNDDTEDKEGPRFVITNPTSGFDAPTSKEVGRNPDGKFVQKVQFDAGVPGEMGLFGDVVWADKLRGVVPEPGPRNRIDATIIEERQSLFDANFDGDIDGDVFDHQENIDIQHEFGQDFFRGRRDPSEPDSEIGNLNFPRLPTEIRVFNASSINLFESGGARNLNRSISTEPESSPANGDGPAEAVAPAREDNFVSPIQRIIGVAPDFQQIFIPLVPPIYMPVIVVSEDRPFALEKNDFDPPRIVDPQEGLVKYGYLGEDQELDEKDSKTWPDGVTESFIQDIKAQVRQGNLIEFPLGDYIIQVERTEGGKVEEIPFKKTADQSGDGQPDIEDQVPLPGFDQSASNKVPGANENEAQVSLPTNAEDSWVDAWRVWGDEAQPLNSENAVDPLRQKETNRNANEERARRLRHQRAVEQLNLRQVEQEQEEELSLDWKMGPPNEPGRPADFVAGTSLVAGSLVMAKYHGNTRGNRWREAWTRQVFSRWRR